MSADLPTDLSALLGPILDPASRTWWPALAMSAVIAGLVWAIQRPGWTVSGLLAAVRHRSSILDLQLMLGRHLVGLLVGGGGVAGAWVIATHGVRLLDAGLGVPTLVLPGWVATALYSVVLFVAWDFSRFVTHWLMHRLPALWALHQVHHSAEVLTPLTFHRIHPLESLLYQLRGALVTGIVSALAFWLFRGSASPAELLGVPAAGLVLNVVTGNLRHSHVWLRFPAPVERWLLSPAQHQVHHSADPRHHGRNLGTWLAVWDRLAGTLVIETQQPQEYGLPAGQRNHGDDLLSAWFGPLRDLGRGLVRWAPALLAMVLSSAAWGQAPSQTAEEESEAEETDETNETDEEKEPGALPGMEVIVYAEDGTPRVAGSAHVIDEEVLERFEYDNIEQIVSQIPGVTTRGEDGYGLRPNIGIRGANSDRSAKITLMEDGVLLAPAPYAAPAAYYFPMSARMVGVEVFKGPAATRHGPHTVGGAINLLSRPVPEGPAGELDLAVGNHTTLRGDGWVGTRNDHLGVLAEVVHLRTAGFKTLPDDSPTGFDHTEAMVKGLWQPESAHTLQLKLGYTNETSNETYLGLAPSDYADDPYQRYAATADGLMMYDRTQAELSWEAEPGAEWRLRTVAYHHWLGRSWTKLNGFADGTDLHDLLQADPDAGSGAVYMAILRGEEDSSTAEQALRVGTNDRRFHSFGLQHTARWERFGDTVSSTLEGGLRLHGDVVDRLHTEQLHDMVSGQLETQDGPVDTTQDSHAIAQAVAAHLHEDLRIGVLHLLPGARLEVVRTSKETVGQPVEDSVTRAVLLPGGAVMVQPLPWLDLFAGAHRGFSPVAPGEPAEARPELAWSYELGSRVSEGDAHAEVVGFAVDYINLTGDCTLSGGCSGDDVGRQFSGGQAWVYGVEAAAGHTLLLPAAMSLPVEATYALTQSRFRTGFQSAFPQFGSVAVGDSLPYSPQHQVGARLALVHPRFDLGTGLSWRSEMLDEAGTFPATDLDIPALLLLDAAASVQVLEQLSIYVTGTNLTGSQAITSWRPAGARPTAPLQVMAGLELGSL